MNLNYRQYVIIGSYFLQLTSERIRIFCNLQCEKIITNNDTDMKTNILLLLGLLLLPSFAFTQSEQNFLKVQGESRIQYVPDDMLFQISIQSKNKDYIQVNEALKQKYNLLVENLVKKGIDKERIRSGRLNIRENYIYTDRERKQEGYLGDMGVSIQLPHETSVMNTILGVLNDERLSTNYNIGFVLSEQKQKKLRDQAIQSAIKDAADKAYLIAGSLHIQLGGIAEIQYGPVGAPIGLYKSQDALMMRAESQMQTDIEINPEELSLRESIFIVWNILQ